MKNLIENFYLDKIDKTWNDFFFNYLDQKELEELLKAVESELENKKCYPTKRDIFRLFCELPFEELKVIILGQDPYHQKDVADGIAFSTRKSFTPASLKNILIELKNDLTSIKERKNPNLIGWVKQGVFLINTALTVVEGSPLSHSNLWEKFTHSLLKYIDLHHRDLIWVFWGNESKKLKDKCQIKSNFVISSPHPSPFSASYGFFNSKPFSRINKILRSLNKSEIQWIE